MAADLPVRVIPRASKAGIAGTRDGAVLVRIGAAPVDGAANAELIDTIAGALRVPRRDVTLISGVASRLKRVRVEGLTLDEAWRRLGLEP